MTGELQVTRQDAVEVLYFCGYRISSEKTDDEVARKLNVLHEILPEGEEPQGRVAELVALWKPHAINNGKFVVVAAAAATPPAAVPADPAPAAAPPAAAPPADPPQAPAVADPPPAAPPATAPAAPVAPAAPEATVPAAPPPAAAPAQAAPPPAAAAPAAPAAPATAEPPAPAPAADAAPQDDKPPRKPRKDKGSKRGKGKGKGKTGEASGNPQSVTGDQRGRRREESSAFVAGQVLREMGLEGGITEEKKARYRQLRGKTKMSQDDWYFGTAFNAVCGFLGKFPEQAPAPAAPPAAAAPEATAPAAPPPAAPAATPA